MDVREKLVELQSIITCPNAICNFCEHFKNKDACEKHKKEVIADNMIAHGVTVQEWISVKDERKPKQLQECLCVCQFDDDAKGEWRFNNVLKWHDVPYQDNGIVNRPHFTDEGVHGMVVTHWMPLPKLPQPPKGE